MVLIAFIWALLQLLMMIVGMTVGLAVLTNCRKICIVASMPLNDSIQATGTPVKWIELMIWKKGSKHTMSPVILGYQGE